MKIGIFTDPHYSSQKITCKTRYNSRSLQKIRDAYEEFAHSGCEAVICLGDLIDREADHDAEIRNLKEIAKVIQAFPMRTIIVMGNHDAFCFTSDEFYGILGDDCRPSPIQTEKNTLLFLDACHFTSGAHYAPGDTDWRDTCFPQTEWLRSALSDSKSGVCILMHQNIDPCIRADHCLSNADEIRRILEESGRVHQVYQGHYHPGCQSGAHGIHYITLPAMCEHEDAYYIIDL